MATRLELHEELITIPEIHGHAYYQPPEGYKLQYPCIVYDLDYEHTFDADNLIYNRRKRYSITVMDRSSESVVAEQVGEMFQIKMERHFVSDNLHHYVYNLIW